MDIFSKDVDNRSPIIESIVQQSHIANFPIIQQLFFFTNQI